MHASGQLVFSPSGQSKYDLFGCRRTLSSTTSESVARALSLPPPPPAEPAAQDLPPIARQQTAVFSQLHCGRFQRLPPAPGNSRHAETQFTAVSILDGHYMRQPACSSTSRTRRLPSAPHAAPPESAAFSVAAEPPASEATSSQDPDEWRLEVRDASQEAAFRRRRQRMRSRTRSFSLPPSRPSILQEPS